MHLDILGTDSFKRLEVSLEPCKLQQIEVAHSAEGGGGIPHLQRMCMLHPHMISLTMMEGASPFLFRGLSRHPNFRSEDGCVILTSFKKVRVATLSHLRKLRWHPNRVSVGSDMPLLFIRGWGCPSTSLPSCVTSHSQLSSSSSTKMIWHHTSRKRENKNKLHLSLSLSLYIYIYSYSSIYRDSYPSIHASIYVSIYRPIYLSIYSGGIMGAVYPSIHLPILETSGSEPHIYPSVYSGSGCI